MTVTKQEALEAATWLHNAANRPEAFGHCERLRAFIEQQSDATNSELAELRDYADRCSFASGIYYAADGHNDERGPIDSVESAIKANFVRANECARDHSAPTGDAARHVEVLRDYFNNPYAGTSRRFKHDEFMEAIEAAIASLSESELVRAKARAWDAYRVWLASTSGHDAAWKPVDAARAEVERLESAVGK